MRIASLLSSATEILFGLGLGDQVVAVSHECDYPIEATRRPRATRSHLDGERSSLAIDEQVKTRLAAGLPLYEIDRGLLVSLCPDVIVTQAQCDVCAIRYADVLEVVAHETALHGTQVVALNPHTLDEVLADIERVANVVQAAEMARPWVRSLTDRVDCVRQMTATLTPSAWPRVACIEWIEPLMCAGNWMPELIEFAGGRPSFAERGGHSRYTAWNELRAFDPEVIVVMPCGFDLSRTLLEAERLRQLPDWNTLSAVRAGCVFAVDGNAYFNRSGPRLIDSLELLARLFHPRLHGLRGDESGEASIWRRWS